MKKVVLKLNVHDEKAKQKALKTVSTIPGIDFIAIDMHQAQLTVIGIMDPVNIVRKLRKNWPTTDIIIVGPAIEPEAEKKEEPKKEEEKKEEAGKEDAKKEEEEKDEGKKEEEKKVNVVPELVQAYRAYYPQMTNTYYVQSMEENPNACTIC
ncbi:heavy metal-associated isoprenylated plant protein 39-like isoform X2 [Silene latifolia]|uniref:heavy metal-associated isoprenylated plant protein 39-like isoform X2 n=1 Tax=Silene latifolia TaxID=37657 RepID=UPI003D784CBC